MAGAAAQAEATVEPDAVAPGWARAGRDPSPVAFPRAVGVIVLAVAALASHVVVALAFASVVRSKDRQSARERDLLTNQLLHAAGRTWTPPPADKPEVPLVRGVVNIHPAQWPE